MSTTRLQVRNVPASWDEKALKAVFVAGVKARATKEAPRVKQVRRRRGGAARGTARCRMHASAALQRQSMWHLALAA